MAVRVFHKVILKRLTRKIRFSLLLTGTETPFTNLAVVPCAIAVLLGPARTNYTKAGKAAGSRCQSEPLDARCPHWLASAFLLKPHVFAVSKFADANEITG